LSARSQEITPAGQRSCRVPHSKRTADRCRACARCAAASLMAAPCPWGHQVWPSPSYPGWPAVLFAALADHPSL